MEQSKLDQVKLESSILAEFAFMASSMVIEEEYAGLKRVIAALEQHSARLSSLLSEPPAVVQQEKKAKK